MSHPASAHVLELLASLGEGGTAVVNEAQEPGLLRRVAVKAPRAPAFAAQLEQEARVLSVLEHPHIPPLYALLPGPRLVLPKLEGHRLDAVIADPELARSTRRGEDDTAFVVRIMTALCDALAHAHSRRILHRDLKPDNLMLGAFGEIYVLDWGQAVSLDADDPRPLPRAVDIDSIDGTPYYLAPEQALLQPLTEQTDLFALGCILHELLTGQRRNPGRSSVAILASAQAPQPFVYDDTVDPDLAELANALTSRDPADRPPSAAEVRTFLLSWGSRQRARSLVAEAERQRPLFEQAWQTEGNEALALQLIAQIDHSLRRALALWPDHPTAARLADRATRDAIDLHLDLGHVSVAQGLVDSLSTPDDLVSDKVDRAVRASDAQAFDAVAMARYRDAYFAPGSDRLFRASLGAIGGIVTAALTLSAVLYHRLVAEITYTVMVPLACLFGAMMLLTVVAGSLRRTLGSARYVKQFGVLSAMVPLQWAAAAWLALPMQAAVAWNLAMAGTSLVAAGAATRYLPSVLGGAVFLGGFLLTVVLPGGAIELLAVTSGLSFALFALSHALLPAPPGDPQ